jgi:hypothetical protein
MHAINQRALVFDSTLRRFMDPITLHRGTLMDEDLSEMSREELVAEIKKLRQGIRQHRDSNRHELCWHHPALWGLLPEKTDPIPVVPELSIPAPSWKQSIGMRLNSGSTAGAVLWFREFTREIATRFRDTEAMRRHREPE